MPDLAERIARIAQDPALPQSVEEAARQTAVLPVLDALGWDCWDGNEVTPEFEVRGGRVDYCLQSGGRRLVLIEVKRTGTDLSSHEEQLLRYAFDERAPLAALTDGRVWWLYLPRADAQWEQRRFCSLDFQTDRPEEAAAALERFLGRDASARGDTVREAQQEFESQERDRVVRAGLQDAWHEELRDPKSLLIDLLTDRVREHTGHSPDPETIAAFLQGVAGGTNAEPPMPRREREPATSAREGRRRGRRATPEPAVTMHEPEAKPLPVEPASKEPESFKGRRPIGFWLDDTRHEFSNWRELLPRVCEQLAGEAPATFVEHVTHVTGLSFLRPSAPDSPDWVPVGSTGLHLNVGITADAAVDRARRTIISVRGNDGGFRVEAADASTAGSGLGPRAPVSYAGRPLTGFWLDGRREEATIWSQMLQMVCEHIASQDGPGFAERVVGLRGRTRRYFSRQQKDLFRPMQIGNSGLFVERNLSADDCVRLARRILVAVRGNDESFRIELAE